MNNTTLLTVLAALIIGAGIGYALAVNPAPEGMHQMADGTMMPNVATNGASMEHSMDAMMSGLEGKTGDAFDRAFLEEMIVHHEGAVDMAEALLKNTKRPELKKLGSDIITAQTGEIQMMKNWLQEWF
ncbi:DUF305 domain-containing protein [Patescibacteria group bacterium]|nr:DUF305 domain-containing protein [Patescibacteria group bacterium]